MCWHFMRAWAQATNNHRAGPVRTTFYCGQWAEWNVDVIGAGATYEGDFVLFRQIIRALRGHLRASIGNSSTFKVLMNSEKTGCTDVHMSTLILKLDTKCVLASASGALCWEMSGWSLDSGPCYDCGIKDHPLISKVHPKQYWVRGLAIAVHNPKQDLLVLKTKTFMMRYRAFFGWVLA